MKKKLLAAALLAIPLGTMTEGIRSVIQNPGTVGTDGRSMQGVVQQPDVTYGTPISQEEFGVEGAVYGTPVTAEDMRGTPIGGSIEIDTTTQRTDLMSEIRKTQGKKPSEVAKERKTTAKKTTTTKTPRSEKKTTTEKKTTAKNGNAKKTMKKTERTYTRNK